MLHKIRNLKRITAVAMFFVLITAMLAGCGKGQNDIEGNVSNAVDNQEVNEQDAALSEKSEKNTAMGRYVESVADISDLCVRSGRLFQRSDGTLVVPDFYMPEIVSKDNGITWQAENTEWFHELIEKQTYIMDMAYGADGTVGIIYDGDTGTNVESDNESGDGTSTEESIEENTEEEGAVEDDGLNPVCMIIQPDGTKIPVQISVTEDDVWPYGVWISDTGRIFVTTLGPNIYEVYEDGSSKKFLSLEGRPELIQFQGDLMIMDGTGFDGISLYDMKNEEFVEDEVLADFVSENYKERSVYNGGEYFDLYIFPGEENVIYLAGRKGLYRHVIGGSAIEQIIDGSLSCFNNPSYLLHGMVMLPDNEFLALFNNKVVRFTYNPDIPTVPNEKLKVYSLEDSDTLRQAITIYQTNHPEVYVNYEIGMGEDSSVTRDDALKKLNTQIMAGDGPDLMVLDDMPVDSYIEKGMLLDLTDFLSSLNGDNEIFKNIADAFLVDERIYMIPCEMQLPLVGGREKYVSQMNDLEGIADAAEELRRDNPEKDLFGICSEKGIMQKFSMISAPAWKNGEGKLNQDAIKEFLLQIKRIYDAQMDGIEEEAVERYEQREERMIAYYGDNAYRSRTLNEFDYLTGNVQVEGGTLTDMYSYAYFTSIKKAKGFEDSVTIPMNGQSQNVFIPQNLIGISAASANTERAEELLSVLLGKENQSSLFKGFAVNKAAFEDGFVIDERYVSEDGIYGYLGFSDSEGLEVTLEVYWPNEEQKQDLRDWITSVDTPYIEDTLLENAVYEEGVSYIQGDSSLEDAVSAIEKKVAIYMAE